MNFSSILFRKKVLCSQFLFLTARMPKSKKSAIESKKKGSTAQGMQAKAGLEKGAVSCSTKGEIIIKIHAKPGAKESGITDIGSESIGIQISAPPIDGEANKELLRYLAEILSVKKSELSLEKGSRSKEKKVVFSGASMTLDSVLIKLRDASKQQ